MIYIYYIEKTGNIIGEYKCSRYSSKNCKGRVHVILECEENERESESESENEKKLLFCIKCSHTCNSINSSGIAVDMNLIIDAKQEMSNIATTTATQDMSKTAKCIANEIHKVFCDKYQGNQCT